MNVLFYLGNKYSFIVIFHGKRLKTRQVFTGDYCTKWLIEEGLRKKA